MTARILVAAVVGAIVMFIWSSIAHMVLPLGEAGIRELPNEPAVLDALKTSVGDARGLYIFPGTGLGPDATRAQRREAMGKVQEKIANNPSGFLMYHPAGRQVNFGKLLGVEFATELAEAVLVLFLLAQTNIASFAGRVFFVTVAGVLAAIATNVSYWNWYGFPKRYTAAYMCIQVVGFFLVGIVGGLMLKRRNANTIR
jgi:hypothetical protein